MDLDKLKALIHMFEESTLSEMEIEQEGQRVRLRKPQPKDQAPAAVSLLPAGGHAAVPQPYEPAAPTARAGTSTPDPVREEAASPEDDEDLVTIDSPMVGVFYAAPAPNDPPFVNEDDIVAADQTVCIIEAMKLMNEVSAQFPAKIVKRLVENAEPVEFGQPLFAVRPLEQD